MARDAAIAEVKGILGKRTFAPAYLAKMNKEQKRAIIRCSLFFKEKFDVDGLFIKLKARLVAGGDRQFDIGDVSSPTVSSEALFATLAIAASEGRHLMSVDIEAAYLECDMEGEPVFMMLPPQLASIVVQLDPKFKSAVNLNGTLLVKLKKALYGCKQSAKLWYKKMSTTLVKLGYEANEVEQCVFNKIVNNSQITVSIHVDDLLGSHVDEKVLEAEMIKIGKCFSGYKIQKGPKLSHLGMTITRLENGNIFTDMASYTKQSVDIWGDTAVHKHPANANLFTDVDDGLLDEEKKAKYHSCVQRLIYLAKKTRCDIAAAVSHLGSRVLNPSHDDWRKLDYLFGYLTFTIDLGVMFTFKGSLNPVAFTDASFLAHMNMKSRSGILILLAGGVIYISSVRQKLVTKSTSESELVALCDGATALLVIRKFLIAQGYDLGKSTIMEDNKSTIDMVKAGRPTSFRTKHIAMRYFFVKDYIEAGELDVQYCMTSEMISDMLTKPLVGAQFNYLRDKVVVKLSGDY